MSFFITRVTGTVGSSVVVAVISSKEAKEIHTPLNVWVEKEFGKYATIEYLETYHASTISTTDLEIGRMLDLDDYMSNNVDSFTAMSESYKN